MRSRMCALAANPEQLVHDQKDSRFIIHQPPPECFHTENDSESHLDVGIISSEDQRGDPVVFLHEGEDRIPPIAELENNSLPLARKLHPSSP